MLITTDLGDDDDNRTSLWHGAGTEKDIELWQQARVMNCGKC